MAGLAAVISPTLISIKTAQDVLPPPPPILAPFICASSAPGCGALLHARHLLPRNSWLNFISTLLWSTYHFLLCTQASPWMIQLGSQDITGQMSKVGSIYLSTYKIYTIKSSSPKYSWHQNYTQLKTGSGASITAETKTGLASEHVLPLPGSVPAKAPPRLVSDLLFWHWCTYINIHNNRRRRFLVGLFMIVSRLLLLLTINVIII